MASQIKERGISALQGFLRHTWIDSCMHSQSVVGAYSLHNEYKYKKQPAVFQTNQECVFSTLTVFITDILFQLFVPIWSQVVLVPLDRGKISNSRITNWAKFMGRMTKGLVSNCQGSHFQHFLSPWFTIGCKEGHWRLKSYHLRNFFLLISFSCTKLHIVGHCYNLHPKPFMVFPSRLHYYAGATQGR